MSATRGKWHPPPPPTPRILHFPRRSRLFRPVKPRTKSPAAAKQNLEALMRQESRRFRGDGRREKVAVSSFSPSAEMSRDSSERWRFQADVLRAECNFLRMEREVALRNLERNRAQMESAVRSAMETMISERKKVDGRIGSKAMALDEEIEEMQAKLEEIQGGFRWRREDGGQFGGNFDRRASVLRRRLETMEETGVREIREVADQKCRFPEVEKLRMKMEGLSRGMRERMEEQGMFFLSFDSAAGRDGHRVFGCTEVGAMADRRLCLRQSEEFGSCCNCKELVDKIVEQVMAEARQWGEMQAMLDKVKTDMEELRSSRDHWEHRALSSELNLRSLHSQMLEWKRRALDSEQAALELRKAEASSLPSLSDQLHSEICRLKQLKIRDKQQKSRDLEAVKEKRALVCRFMESKKENGLPKGRSPLQEIGNLPLLI